MTDYERAQQPSLNTVNVHGANSGNIASGNRDVVQTAATRSGLDAAEIADIMRAVIEVAGQLGLPERDRAELSRTAESVQYELAASEPDVSQIKALGGKVIKLLGSTVGSALPVVLTKYLEMKLGLGPVS